MIRLTRAAALLMLAIGLAITFFASLIIGSASISPARIMAFLFVEDGSYERVVVFTLRLPRALAGLLIGAALGTAGAIMQGLTLNPLASPGLLGINAGAAFAVVLATLIFGGGSLSTYAVAAWIGAALAAAIVYAIGSFGSGGPTPLKLTLAGAVFSSFIGSLTAAILLSDAGTLDQVRLWTVGSLAGRQMDHVATQAPFIVAGLVMAVLLGRSITAQSLGHDTARALGQRTLAVRLGGGGCVAILAGSAVAIAGPVGFVGLVAPHLARMFVGTDYRWVIPAAGLTGAILVALADLGTRFIFPGEELPIGITMALIGAPFFIYLARYKVRR